MGTLSLTLPDERSGTVNDNGFAALPQDKQAAAIADSRAPILSAPSTLAHDTQGSIHAISADGVAHEFPAGTDQAVIDKAMRSYATQQAASANPSFSADLQGGVHDLGTSVSQGLNVAGGIMSRNGMPDWGGDVSAAGGWIGGHTPDAPVGVPPSQRLANAIKVGDWSAVPALVAHSAARALPSAAPVLAAGAVGGPIGAGVAAGALAEGPEAYARAANNGRSEPTTGDAVASIPGAVAEGVGGALLPGSSRLASPLARGAYRVASDIAGGAVMDAGGQLGATVGTDKGAQLDPFQTAGAALTQGAIGAARSLPDAVATGIKSASDRALASTLEAPGTREDAESVIRVGNLMDAVRANAVRNSGQPLPDTVIANSVKSDLVTKLNGQIKQLRDAGLIDALDSNGLRQLVNNQALRANNTISEGLPGVASLYDRVDDLNLPAPVIAQLKADVRDLNTVSAQSFIKNTVGPFQAAGTLAGRLGAIGAGLMSASPMGVIEGVIGNPLAGKVGGAIGSIADRALGTNTPPIVLQRLNAQRVLRQMGADPDNVGATSDAATITAQRAIAAANVDRQAADFNTLSANDQAALDTQAEQAAKLKQTQVDASYRENQSRQAQIDAAYDANQPQAPGQVSAFLSGKLDDPSLFPPPKLTTAQEIALQVNRLRNAQVLMNQQANQAKLFTQAGASDMGSQGQAALDKLTRQNATTLAAAVATPSPRPDVPPEAAQAAQDTMKARADRMLGNVSDAALVGNPGDPVPVNTPIRAAQGLPKAPSVSALPPLRVDTPETVRAALEQADQQLRTDTQTTPDIAGAMAGQRLQQAKGVLDGTMPYLTPGSRYLANTIPGATHADAVALARAAEDAGAVPKGTADLVDKSPAPLDRGLLEAVKAHAAGTQRAVEDQPPIWSPTRYQAAVANYHLHVANDVAALRTQGQHEAANALLDIAINQHSKAGKAAARAALPPAIAKQIPDYVVNQGGN